EALIRERLAAPRPQAFSGDDAVNLASRPRALGEQLESTSDEGCNGVVDDQARQRRPGILVAGWRLMLPTAALRAFLHPGPRSLCALIVVEFGLRRRQPARKDSEGARVDAFRCRAQLDAEALELKAEQN